MSDRPIPARWPRIDARAAAVPGRQLRPGLRGLGDADRLSEHLPESGLDQFRHRDPSRRGFLLELQHDLIVYDQGGLHMENHITKIA